VLPLLAAMLGMDPSPCNLSGQGEVEVCERLYLRSRLAALAAPSWVLSTDGAQVMHGLSWTLGIDVPREEWGDYFAYGLKPQDERGFPFHLGVAASLVVFPGAGVEGRLLARARVMSLVWPSNPALSFLHLTAGAGAVGGTWGVCPRIELRARVGHLAWGGLALVIGFQPNIARERYTTDVSVGLDAPWVWWW
jgi:hypothetical protein